MWSASVSIFLSILLIFISIAFVTLFERKILSLSQLRNGPNNTGFIGVIQPLIDGVNLLHNSTLPPFQSILVGFLLGPAILLINMGAIWTILPTLPNHTNLWCSFFWFLLLLSLNVYGLFLTGLSSISNYSILGSIRACAQSISYEVSFSLIILAGVITTGNNHLLSWSSSLICASIILWLISIVAECNRAPLDFAEGESELISGLNLELSSTPFAYVFVGEYGLIVFLSWTTSILFASGNILITSITLLCILIARSALPRFRYDNLISLCWTAILPLSALWCLLCFFCSTT